MTNIFRDSSIKKINLALSGGGMAGLYQVGVCKHLIELHHSNKLDIVNVYGTSVGAFVGAVFIHHMAKPNTFNDNMNVFHSICINECKVGNIRILSMMRKLCDVMLSDDIHLLCSNKLHIAIMTKDKRGIRQKVITQYSSKNDLINIITTSAFVPLLTGSWLYSTYVCPVTKCSYIAIDGIFTPPIENNHYETLYVNLNKHDYSLIKRMFYFEKSSNIMLNEGYKNSIDFFSNKKEIPTLYLYERGYNTKHKKYLYLFTNKLIWLIVYIWLTFVSQDLL